MNLFLSRCAIGKIAALGLLTSFLVACLPLSMATMNRYQLTESHSMPQSKAVKRVSLLVSQPQALDGYGTDQMLYVNQPYQISEFANHAWVTPPVTMLLPLIMRSIDSSHYFYAVVSDLNVNKTDYRLESTLVRLQQNFLVKPSQLQLVMQVVLTRSRDSHVIASEIIYESLPCPKDSPMGGVIAANQAARHLTSRMAHFAIEHVKQDQS